MAKKQSTMPMSTAGLIRYFEESEKTIKIKPEYIVGFAIGMAIAEIAIKIFFVI